jgi:dTDP-4-amino-4,6-dideoxygalactose transaminase
LVIEDCAQAQVATITNEPVGSFGDAAAFSFCQDKIMTTGGEGGMLVANDSAAFERAWAFKDHGKDYSAAHRQQLKKSFPLLHQTAGTNWPDDGVAGSFRTAPACESPRMD